MKACKDCKHFRRFWLDKSLSKCVSPNNNMILNPIIGEYIIEKEFCSIARTDYAFIKNCGSEAKWFESK